MSAEMQNFEGKATGRSQKTSRRRIQFGWRAKYGANSVLFSVAFIALIVLVNVAIARHPFRFDVTRNQDFSLSQQTRAVIANLKEPVKITAFWQEGGLDAQMVKDLLHEYELASDKIQVEFVDPLANPDRARQNNVNTNGTTILQSGSQTKRIDSSELFQYDYYSSDPNQLPTFVGEQAFTAALVDLSETSSRLIYFLTGHGEMSTSSDLSSLATRLKYEGYDSKDLALPMLGAVPDDATAVVIAGPTSDFSQTEIDSLDKYLSEGGRVIAMLDTPLDTKGTLARLEALLAKWGIKVRDDVVIDPQRYMVPYASWPIPTMADHEITKPLRSSQQLVVFPHARSVTADPSVADYIQVTDLLTTSAASWGETTLDAQKSPKKDAQDVGGPLTVGMLATAKVSDIKVDQPTDSQSAIGTSSTEASSALTGDAGSKPKADSTATSLALDTAAAKADTQTKPTSRSDEVRLAVFGDASFISNNYLELGNPDLFLNTVNWVVGKENMINIRPKTIDLPQVNMTSSEFRTVFYGTVVLLPLLLLAAGGAVYLGRRHL